MLGFGGGKGASVGRLQAGSDVDGSWSRRGLLEGRSAAIVEEAAGSVRRGEARFWWRIRGAMVVRKRTMGSCRRAGSSQWRKLASGRAGSLALSYCALLQSSCRYLQFFLSFERR